MAKTNDSPEAVIASAKRPMGALEDTNPHAVANEGGYGGTLVPHGHTTNGDPTVQVIGHRSPVIDENIGASYRMDFGLDRPVEPAAGPTMQNARILPSKSGFKDSFQGGMGG